MKKNISQQGAISIILVVLLLAELLVIGLGISLLAVKQIKMSGQIGRSVVAYYAAEAGAEKCLYQVGKGTEGCALVGGQISGNLTGDLSEATYEAKSDGEVGVYPDHGTITSIGQFEGIARKVELSW